MISMDMKVLRIQSWQTYEWLLKKHYAKRIPQITDAFGLYHGKVLIGVVTYGKPASPFLCKGVCGAKYFDIVYELNRVCLADNIKNQASFAVSHSLRQLSKPRIIVSYADTAMGHTGYIYQACNFLYCGLSAARTDVDTNGNHSRHMKNFDTSKRVARSQKHRYIYFVGSKKQKKELLSNLQYRQSAYPKADVQHYDSSAQISTQMIMF